MAVQTLREFIQEHGAERVAAWCGVRPRTVVDWRRGQRVPKAKYIPALVERGLTVAGIFAAAANDAKLPRQQPAREGGRA